MPTAVVPLHGPDPIAGAVGAFLTQADLAEATRREYGKHLGRLAGRLGADRPLSALVAGELERAITELRFGPGRACRCWSRRLPACSTRPPPVPPNCCQPTSVTSTWKTAACGSPPRAATPSGATSSPVLPESCPGCCLGAGGYGDAALQAKSRHKSRRSLEPYVNVPTELAAKITAETDPHRQRR